MTEIALRGAGGDLVRGLWFVGDAAAGLRPWIDITAGEAVDLRRLARLVGPGGSVMVAYGRDETERALRRRVPPSATPLGLALLDAGCRWFKDWYFAEGGREGPAKLQGTVPLDAERARQSERALAQELAAFLARPDVRSHDRKRAGRALRVLSTAEVGQAHTARKSTM